MSSGRRDPHADALPARPVDADEIARALRPLASATRVGLLHFLTRPHYLEEIATHLGMSRQATQRHTDLLVEGGLIRRQPGVRDTGPVVDYVVSPQRLFALSEEFAKLAVLRPHGAIAARATEATDDPATVATPVGPALVLVHGVRLLRSWLLAPGDGPWTIGRATTAYASLDYDPFVSQVHAEVRREAGRIAIADAGSSNGTYVNGARVPDEGSTSLVPGDVIGVGKSLLVYRSGPQQ